MKENLQLKICDGWGSPSRCSRSCLFACGKSEEPCTVIFPVPVQRENLCDLTKVLPIKIPFIFFENRLFVCDETLEQ